jgi:HEAT repeat protein
MIMARIPRDLRSLARSHTRRAINGLLQVLEDEDAAPSARVAAANALLERGWGKPVSTNDGMRTDDRPFSELSTSDLVAQREALLARIGQGARGPNAGETEPADLCEHDRDSGGADPS